MHDHAKLIPKYITIYQKMHMASFLIFPYQFIHISFPPSDCSDACLWNTCSKQQEEAAFENHHRLLKHLTIWSVVFLCVTYTYVVDIHRP